MICIWLISLELPRERRGYRISDETHNEQIDGQNDVFDSHRPLHIEFSQIVDLQVKKPTSAGWLFCCLVDIWSLRERARTSCVQLVLLPLTKNRNLTVHQQGQQPVTELGELLVLLVKALHL